MPVHPVFEEAIEKVRVSLVFSGFDCDPDEITEALGLEPDEVRRMGEPLGTGKQTSPSAPWNLWALMSRKDSKDPNEHIRKLLEQLAGKEDRIRPAWNPGFNVLWKSEVLGAGAGPFYEKDVIRGMARIGAELWQDLYG